MNIKGIVIGLVSIIVAMVGFTLKVLINNQMSSKVSIHDNKNKITINKTHIDHLDEIVDRDCK